MKKINATMLIVVLSAGGCSTFKDTAYSGYSVPDLKVGSDSVYMQLVKQLQSDPVLLEKKCFNIPVGDGNKGPCAAQRNAAMSVLLMESERLCVDYRRTIYGNDATMNITSGTFTNLFSGAAAVSGSSGMKSLLSSLALFSNSERSLVNETVYKTALVNAVDKKIVQRRDSLAHGIYAKFNMAIDSYSPAQALQEAISFHYSCSFMDGLRLALDEGVQDGPSQKIERLKERARRIGEELNTVDKEKESERLDALKGRLKEINSELTKLEVQ